MISKVQPADSKLRGATYHCFRVWSSSSQRQHLVIVYLAHEQLPPDPSATAFLLDDNLKLPHHALQKSPRPTEAFPLLAGESRELELIHEKSPRSDGQQSQERINRGESGGALEGGELFGVKGAVGAHPIARLAESAQKWGTPHALLPDRPERRARRRQAPQRVDIARRHDLRQQFRRQVQESRFQSQRFHPRIRTNGWCGAVSEYLRRLEEREVGRKESGGFGCKMHFRFHQRNLTGSPR